MKENLKCVSITKRDYDVASALHIKAYGDALPVVRDNRMPGSESDYCPRCGCFGVRREDSYCGRCGAELLERKAVER